MRRSLLGVILCAVAVSAHGFTYYTDAQILAMSDEQARALLAPTQMENRGYLQQIRFLREQEKLKHDACMLRKYAFKRMSQDEWDNTPCAD